jgi:hypothetical protein
MRPVKALVKEPRLNGEPAVYVVVAVSPPERLEFVPQAKPRMVEDALPSAVIEPFNVAPVVEVAVAGEVVRVGTDIVTVGVTALDGLDLSDIPITLAVVRILALTVNV